MKPQGRVLVILLGIVAIVSMAGAGAAVFLQMQERDLRLAKERELSVVKTQKEEVEQELEEVKAAKEKAETELTQAKTQVEQALAQVAEERKAKDTLAKSVDDRQKEVDRLAKDMEQFKTERKTFQDQVAKLKGDQEKLQKQLTDLEQAKADLESKLLEFSKHPNVELDRVVVTPGEPGEGAGQTAAATGGGLQGKVVVVNREYDFIVMNLGKNQGLAIGQEFQILRGQQVLGKVRVEKLYDELSAAAILPESHKDAIREGDVVAAI